MNVTATRCPDTSAAALSRPPKPSDNPILAVAARAAALRAQGVDVVSLAAGEPETSTAASVVRAAQQAADDPTLHHYGPAAGLPELREAIATQTTAAGVPTTTAQVQVTQGAKHALFTTLAVLTVPGDDVLVVTPGWPGHTEVVLAARVNPVTVDTGRAGLRLTVDALDQARTPRTRALVLANPGNPSGVLHNADELRAIVGWCAVHDIHLVADEVYSQLTFDHAHVPAAAAAPEHRDRIITIGAVSKAHAMTGWRVGWLITTPERVADARRHIAATITHVPGINQAAAVAGLLTPGQTAADLADHLLHTAHVATVPGDAFHDPGHLRLCFAVADHSLDTAITRLTRELTRIQGRS